MDHLPHFRRESSIVERIARQVADKPPLIPSCPDWSMANLLVHLGAVHRYVIHIIVNRLTEQPDLTDPTFAQLPDGHETWPHPAATEPCHDPMPTAMLDWFADSAATLAEAFATTEPAAPALTWSTEQSVGFWLRMQTIEVAVHRWDAQLAIGAPEPMATELAVDAVAQSLTVMAPARRAWQQAPAGAGERYRFRQTDGANSWTVEFAGDAVRVDTDQGQDDAEAVDVELAATASELMLFLWQRATADQLDVRGDRAVLGRYFTLVPAV